MQSSANQNLILIEVTATYERILADARYLLNRILWLQPWNRDASSALKELETASKERSLR